MKREIYCMKCHNKTWEHIKKVAGTYNEGVVFKKGKSLRDCVCDWCATKIKEDEACVARSIHTPRTPYFVWESEFLYDIE